jgi:hypothetical protein
MIYGLNINLTITQIAETFEGNPHPVLREKSLGKPKRQGTPSTTERTRYRPCNST